MAAGSRTRLRGAIARRAGTGRRTHEWRPRPQVEPPARQVDADGVARRRIHGAVDVAAVDGQLLELSTARRSDLRSPRQRRKSRCRDLVALSRCDRLDGGPVDDDRDPERRSVRDTETHGGVRDGAAVAGRHDQDDDREERPSNGSHPRCQPHRETVAGARPRPSPSPWRGRGGARPWPDCRRSPCHTSDADPSAKCRRKSSGTCRRRRS
jgi:hypothetical protein